MESPPYHRCLDFLETRFYYSEKEKQENMNMKDKNENNWKERGKQDSMTKIMNEAQRPASN